MEAARELDYPASALEIIVARGRQPAVQRNHALRAARGEFIYFLDDDSRPDPANLRRALAHFADPAVKMVGGPNLCPPEAPLLEQVFAVCLASWLAFGPSRARYDRLGKIRDTTEKELILCNLAARRQALLDTGGFDESLYPNEENALMDALQKRGGRLVHDPDFWVFRRPRPNLRAFARMLLNYGRGRAEQFRRHPTPGSALNFVPPLFCGYLASLAVLCAARPDLAGWAAIPLAPYGAALLLQTAVSMRRFGFARSLAAIPLLALTHLLYGAGFWRGLFTAPDKAHLGASGEVSLEINPPARQPPGA